MNELSTHRHTVSTNMHHNNTLCTSDTHSKKFKWSKEPTKLYFLHEFFAFFQHFTGSAWHSQTFPETKRQLTSNHRNERKKKWILFKFLLSSSLWHFLCSFVRKILSRRNTRKFTENPNSKWNFLIQFEERKKKKPAINAKASWNRSKLMWKTQLYRRKKNNMIFKLNYLHVAERTATLTHTREKKTTKHISPTNRLHI